MPNILAIGTTEADSAPITVAAGESTNLYLIGPERNLSVGLPIYRTSSAAADEIIGYLKSAGQGVNGPFQGFVRRPAGRNVGVDEG